VTVRLEYRPNSSAPESVGVWADGRAVPLPAGVTVTSTRAAALAMHAQLRESDYAPLATGELARWGHPAAPGAWWEEGNGAERVGSQAQSVIRSDGRIAPSMPLQEHVS